MSQHSNLRFQNLPSAAEALALKELILTDQAELHIDGPLVPVSLLNNIAVNAFEQSKHLDIDLDDQHRQMWLDHLTLMGWDHIAITDQDLMDRESLKRKCQTILEDDRASTDTRGSWRRFYKIIEQMSYGDFVLSQIAMGDKPLYAIMERYLTLKCTVDNAGFSDRINRAEFDFDTREYWHIRGRVRDAATRYNKRFDELDHLDKLHPVFVEMYRPGEAADLIAELLQTARTEFERLTQELYNWITDYRLAYLSELSEFGLLVRDHAFSISTEAEDILDNGRSENQKSWSWLKSGNPRSNELGEEQVVSAYRTLRQMVHERGLSNIFDLPAAAEAGSISTILSDLLKNFHLARKKIKRFVDDHVARVNSHNIALDDYIHRYQSIQSRLDTLLKEVNGKQIFRSYWEDNTLEIISQKRWLDRTCDTLNGALEQAVHLHAYLEWQQFVSLIEEKDKKVIDALKTFPAEEWMSRFDLWYYENFIEGQDLIPLDYDHRLSQSNRFLHALFTSSWENTLIRVSSLTRDDLKAFFKSNRGFRDWILKDGQPPSANQTEDLHSLAWLFPVNMTSTIPDPMDDRWRVSATPERKADHGINLLPDSSSDTLASYPPVVKTNVLSSTHSERIHEIKKIARFLMTWRGQFEVWQNQRHVYFSFAEHGAQDLIHEWLDEGLRRSVIGKKGDLDLIVESMLNNQGRKFFCVFTQQSTWDRKNWAAQLDFLRWTAFTRHAGFEPLFISWQVIFKNAEFIAFLNRERTGKMAVKGIAAD